MLLSIVIPVYNETDALPALLSALRRVLFLTECEYELLFVNDGSTDGTAELLAEEAAADPRVKILAFSRNFGHQAAITAGLDFAAGDAVVVMDADLQDPPELLPQMLDLYRQGYDVVSAQRRKRASDGVFKRLTAALFYRIMRSMIDKRLVEQVGDFRLFSRRAVLALRNFREQHRFMRGLVTWLGMKEAILPFDRQPRVAGATKYPFWKMLRFSWVAISSFSALPLRLSMAGGLLLSLFGIGYLVFSVFLAAAQRTTVPGWTSLICVAFIFFGVILSAIGLVGDCVARVY